MSREIVCETCNIRLSIPDGAKVKRRDLTWLDLHHGHRLRDSTGIYTSDSSHVQDTPGDRDPSVVCPLCSVGDSFVAMTFVGHGPADFASADGAHPWTGKRDRVDVYSCSECGVRIAVIDEPF